MINLGTKCKLAADCGLDMWNIQWSGITGLSR